MKKIYFYPSEKQPAFQTYDPVGGRSVRFVNGAGYYDVPDNIADHVIDMLPENFGLTKKDIQERRGENVSVAATKKPAAKRKAGGRGKKMTTRKKPAAKKPDHPFVRGMKKVQEFVETVNREIDKKEVHNNDK